MEGKGVLDEKLILILVLFLSPSPPCISELNPMNWIPLQLRQKHMSYPIPYVSRIYPSLLLYWILLILTEPIKSSSLWYNSAVPNVTNHSKGQTHKTPKVWKWMNIRGAISVSSLYILFVSTDISCRYFVTKHLIKCISFCSLSENENVVGAGWFHTPKC